ncbi:MAG: peptidoglycan-binding domain-containing protein [Verrucomicrobiota bacterium]
MLESQVDGKFGPVTEQSVRNFQSRNGLTETGEVDEATGRALGLPFWTAETVRQLDEPFRDPDKFDADHEFQFRSQFEGGYFSAEPEQFVSGDVRKKRSIRSNNSGAMNKRDWHEDLPGYVGRTLADNSGNKTTIFLTPEDGVSAWYLNIVVRYERLFGLISGGATGTTVNVRRLAKAYGFGRPNDPDSAFNSVQLGRIREYTRGWDNWAQKAGLGEIEESDEIDPGDVAEMRRLCYAMSGHEAAAFSPLAFDQIDLGIAQAIDSLPDDITAAIRKPGALDAGAVNLLAQQLPGDADADLKEELGDIEERNAFAAALRELDPGAPPMDAEDAEIWLETLRMQEPDDREEPSVKSLAAEINRAAATDLPPITSANVRWVHNYRNHPDYAHLPAAAQGHGFELSRTVIELAVSISHFAPPYLRHNKLIIAIRGTKLSAGGHSARNQLGIGVAERDPHHSKLNCLIGCFDTDTGRPSLFTASTIPNSGSVAAHYNYVDGHRTDSFRANSLPTGCYELCVGTHRRTTGNHIEGVLRLGDGPEPPDASDATVLRTQNDGIYGTQDFWHLTTPKDNIHPSGGLSYPSSKGCLTVRGGSHSSVGNVPQRRGIR